LLQTTTFPNHMQHRHARKKKAEVTTARSTCTRASAPAVMTGEPAFDPVTTISPTAPEPLARTCAGTATVGFVGC
jgi:hypothetical protein